MNVVGKLLRDLAVTAEAHDKGFVEIRPQGVLQKADCGFLLKIEAAAHRSAGINQKAQLERQIGLATEVYDSLGRLVIPGW